MSFFTMIISFLHKFCMKYERLLLPICKDIHHLSVRRIFCVCLYTTARKARPSWPFLNGLFSRGSIFGISTIRTHFYYFFLLLLRLFVYNRIVNTSFFLNKRSRLQLSAELKGLLLYRNERPRNCYCMKWQRKD